MHWIVQANIDRYTFLLQTESDPIKRVMMVRLLGEERENMKAVMNCEQNWLPKR
jgi:hypothetical protein